MVEVVLDDVAEFFGHAGGFFSLQGIGQILNWLVLAPQGILISKNEAELGAFYLFVMCALISGAARMYADAEAVKRAEKLQAEEWAAMRRRDTEKSRQPSKAKKQEPPIGEKSRPAVSPSPATAPKSPKDIQDAEKSRPGSEASKGEPPIGEAKRRPVVARSAPAAPKSLKEIESELKEANLPPLSAELRNFLRKHGER